MTYSLVFWSMGWLRVLLIVKDDECQLAIERERPKANENKSALLGDRKELWKILEQGNATSK